MRYSSATGLATPHKLQQRRFLNLVNDQTQSEEIGFIRRSGSVHRESFGESVRKASPFFSTWWWRYFDFRCHNCKLPNISSQSKSSLNLMLVLGTVFHGFNFHYLRQL